MLENYFKSRASWLEYVIYHWGLEYNDASQHCLQLRPPLWTATAHMTCLHGYLTGKFRTFQIKPLFSPPPFPCSTPSVFYMLANGSFILPATHATNIGFILDSLTLTASIKWLANFAHSKHRSVLNWTPHLQAKQPAKPRITSLDSPQSPHWSPCSLLSVVST